MTGLQPVDRLEVIVLVDNTIDFSSSDSRNDVMNPRQWASESDLSHMVMAGHGLSLLIRTYIDAVKHEVLYDTGASGKLLSHNLSAMNLDLKEIEGVVLSHGHWDHTGGLIQAISDTNRKGFPVYIHPRMFYPRRVVWSTPQGEQFRDLDPIPSIDEIKSAGGRPILGTGPVGIAENTLLLSGEIPRITEYEKGMPGHRAFIDGEWQNDEAIIDDRCLIANVKKKGLVVMSGCSHAGLINILKETVRLTGETRVHGVVGGLHLIGKKNEPKILPTINDLKPFDLSMLVPTHCTGWKAQHAMARAFPDSYVQGSVGNLYIFGQGALT